jgi:hypothetical protein
VTTFPNSPAVLKGGLVLIDPTTAAVLRVIALQYNPDTVTRTLQVKGAGAEGGDRSEALRLKGPPTETIKLDAEIDATDQLEFPDQNAVTARSGVFPALSALETIIYPTSAQLQANNQLADSGTLEIVPVRITDFSVTEEAFDVALNPIRVKVSLGMRVLSVDDLGFQHKGGGLFMSYLQQKEQLAAQSAGAVLRALGLTRIS